MRNRGILKNNIRLQLWCSYIINLAACILSLTAWTSALLYIIFSSRAFLRNESRLYLKPDDPLTWSPLRRNTLAPAILDLRAFDPGKLGETMVFGDEEEYNGCMQAKGRHWKSDRKGDQDDEEDQFDADMDCSSLQRTYTVIPMPWHITNDEVPTTPHHRAFYSNDLPGVSSSTARRHWSPFSRKDETAIIVSSLEKLKAGTAYDVCVMPADPHFSKIQPGQWKNSSTIPRNVVFCWVLDTHLGPADCTRKRGFNVFSLIKEFLEMSMKAIAMISLSFVLLRRLKKAAQNPHPFVVEQKLNTSYSRHPRYEETRSVVELVQQEIHRNPRVLNMPDGVTITSSWIVAASSIGGLTLISLEPSIQCQRTALRGIFMLVDNFGSTLKVGRATVEHLQSRQLLPMIMTASLPPAAPGPPGPPGSRRFFVMDTDLEVENDTNGGHLHCTSPKSSIQPLFKENLDTDSMFEY